jgi:hypothetical protein
MAEQDLAMRYARCPHRPEFCASDQHKNEGCLENLCGSTSLRLGDDPDNFRRLIYVKIEEIERLQKRLISFLLR